MGEIKTFSGILFDPLNPDARKIRIGDIAHALSMLCRANGHFVHFYSVGQHCINCMQEAAARGDSLRVQLGCLLHDGSEAYLSDVTRPVKAALPAYLEIEAPLQNAIWEKWLGSPLTEAETRQIFAIDDAMLDHEFLALAGTALEEPLPELRSEPLFAFGGFLETEQTFLAHFQALTRKLAGEVTVAQMKQIEKDADAAGLSYTQMMENAGQAAARILREKQPKTTAVFCGTGNNGGDGFVLARVLAEAGVPVRILQVGGEPKTADALLNREKAKALNIPIQTPETLTENDTAWILQADAVVDGLCGTGFHGELRPAGRAACDLMNRAKGFRLALDLPSGLAADTGIPAVGTVQADLTVTFHAPKPCHRLCPRLCGEVKTASIGAELVL